MKSTIILIGPMSAGKSTIAELLAEKLQLPRYAVDEKRWDYYAEIGYDREHASQIAKSDQGMLGLLNYWKPFEAHAVERTLVDHHDEVCIIDFGAGHSVYEDAELFARVERALVDYPNVILLLPSPNLDESVKIVNTRFEQSLEEEDVEVDPVLFEVNKNFVKHPSNHKLAKIVVYTKDQTPEQTCTEIRQKIKRD